MLVSRDSPPIFHPQNLILTFNLVQNKSFRFVKQTLFPPHPIRRLVPGARSAAAAAQGVRRRSEGVLLVEAVPGRHRGGRRPQRVLPAYKSEGMYLVTRQVDYYSFC